jgi:hypothetical protein
MEAERILASHNHTEVQCLDPGNLPRAHKGEHMERADYVTTFPRALLALLVGALVGALAFLLELGVLLALRPSKLSEMTEYVGTTNSDLIMLIALAALVFFAGGLLLIGAPVWWILHRLGHRQWFYAAGLGAVLGSAGFILMSLWNPEWPALSLVSFMTEEFGGLTARNGQLSGEGWSALFRGAIGIAVAGAAAGLGLWKIAYRRRQPRLSSP